MTPSERDAFRQSDLDFALFLVDLTPGQVIPERWTPRANVDEVRFRQELVRLERMVSPGLVVHAYRKRSPRPKTSRQEPTP